MMRFLRGIAILFLALVVVGVAGYVAEGIHGTAQVARAKKEARADLATALPAKRQQALADRDQVRDAYVATWGRPAYAWQELVCDLDTVDAGWIVQHYTQECRIRSVDLIPTAQVTGAGCDWSGLPSRASSGVPGTGPTAGPTAGTGGEPRSGVAVKIGPAGAFEEDHPYRLGCPDGIVEPPKYGTSRLLSGTRPTSLDASPAWILVSLDTAVTTSDLGCDPWAVLFCSAPVDHPVIGDVE